MSLILSIETATSVCSVALHSDGELLAKQTLYIEKSHSGLLAPIIESLISFCGFKLRDLDAVAVSEGPGSYTGLRIGVSTAKGICYALDIPLISVSTLKAMAYEVNKCNFFGSVLCPMLDARRMEVYCWMADADFRELLTIQPHIIDEFSFNEILSEQHVLFFGNGSDKCKPVIKHQNAHFIDGVQPDAANIGYLAWDKFENHDFEDVAYFEPFYLKEFRVTTPKAPKL